MPAFEDHLDDVQEMLDALMPRKDAAVSEAFGIKLMDFSKGQLTQMLAYMLKKKRERIAAGYERLYRAIQQEELGL